MAMLVMRWLTGALLLFACGRVGGCPLCLDSQGYASAQELVSRQRAQMALPGTGGAPPDVINAIRDEVPTAGAGYRLDRDAAGNAVLAQLGDNGTPLKVVEVIRGEMPAGGTIEPSWVIGLPRNAAPSVKPLLLIRARKWQSWANVGPIGVEHAEWLRKLAAAKRTTDTTDAEWRAEAPFVLAHLESAEPLAAEIAYGELARAPYSALRSLKGRLDVLALRQWTADPRLAKRQSLYTLLLGIGGDATDATRLEQRLDAAWKTMDTTNLGPMLAADLELRGPSRMAWIDTRYIGDRDRTVQELQAALLALSVQGGADATIPRARIIESYRRFIRVQQRFAGFVAQDLAAWNDWDAVPEYVALLRSDLPQHPASRYAMWSYLKQSPRADARAAADAMAASAK